MEHEAGVGPGQLGSAFVLRLPRFLEVSGTRFRAVAGNTYVLAEVLNRLDECPNATRLAVLWLQCLDSECFKVSCKGHFPFLSLKGAHCLRSTHML